MKTDELMDAITELDDELLNEAAAAPSEEQLRREKRSGRRPLILRIAAAAAVMALAVGAVAMAGRKPKEPINPGTAVAGETKETVFPADTAKAAQVLAEPEYPAELSWEKEESGRYDQRPHILRAVAARETADLYRGFFADMMLLLLSDQEEENAVMSPVNIWMATAMLAEVSDGQARKEILGAFGVKTIEELREQAAKIWGVCYRDNGREKTVLGNSLWLNNSLNYRESTVRQLAGSYYASAFRGEMGSAALNSRLQQWINEMTGGLLKEQVQNVELPAGTALALISTILHETKWNQEFSKEATKTGIFHGTNGDVEVEYMRNEYDSYEYWTADKYILVRKTTKQGAAYFFLPNEGVSVSEMMKEESFRDLLAEPFWDGNYFGYDAQTGKSTNKTYNGLTGVSALIDLTLPKLDVSCTQDLTFAVQKLGIHAVFDPDAADFTPLTDEPGVYLGTAKQGTRLIMDEEGISAASYVEYLAGAVMPDKFVKIVIDRPFFMLVTGYDDVPLFAGVINEP